MKKPLSFVLAVLAASCTTFHVDRAVQSASSGTLRSSIPDELELLFESDPVFIEIERPVYVPEGEVYVPRPRPSGVAAVRESAAEGVLQPSDYSHGAMIYDYHPDFVYEVYTQPLRATTVSLEPGERAVETPFVSDSERFMLGAGVSYSSGVPVQHIYIKPVEAFLEASLIINTDRRVYHIILRSYRDVYMPMVRWRYFSTGMPSSFIPPPESADSRSDSIAGVDPRYLSFNYTITYGMRKPTWMPELIFDDGQKTYITFPDQVLQRELPAVFENRNDVVNFRVVGKVLIIDKLVETLTIKIEQREISISKKKG